MPVSEDCSTTASAFRIRNGVISESVSDSAAIAEQKQMLNEIPVN